MNRIALTVTLVAALAGAACARQTAPAPQPSAADVRGKPGAPVAVSAQLSGGAGRATVRFDADARDVRVEVAGAEGLTVTSGATPVDGASFAKGESTSFDVAFAPGPGRSYLSVTVTGKFHGAGRRAAVTSFAVGEPTAEQRKGAGTVVQGADGERVKVVVPGN
jgi:hypothetical protein